MKKYILFLLGIIFLTSLSIQTHEITTVYNEANDSIDVFFQAWGCFGLATDPFIPRVCYAHKNLLPYESASYEWKNGQTEKTAIVTIDGKFFQATTHKEYLTWQGFIQVGEELQSISPDFKWINCYDNKLIVFMQVLLIKN